MKFQIARNKNGTIFICTGKVRQYYNEYYLGEFGTESMWLPNASFPQVTFKNSPQEVELKLVETSPLNNSQITIGAKIRLKANPDVILSIISNDCHENEFECSNGSVLSLKQIEKYYDII